MLKSITKKLITIAASVMLVATLVVPAMAATTYEPVVGTSATFKKFLIVEAGSDVPNVTFSYSIAGGTAQSYTVGTNMAVYSGTDSERVTGVPVPASTSFVQGQTTYNAVQSGDIDIARAASARDESKTAATGVEFETAKHELYAKSDLVIDFSGVSYKEPGIYRYILTETASPADEAAGIMHDNDIDRVLDVYVTDDGNGTLAISQYVMHTVDGAVAMGDNNGSADVTTDGAALADKTDGFTNEYKSDDLVISKTVAGNEASRDQYFAVTVEFAGLNPSGLYNVSLADDGVDDTTDGNADATSGNTPSTLPAYRGQTNVTTITASDTGTATATFYLQHGQSVAIRNLPLNATYKVVENEEDYKSSLKIDNTSVTGTAFSTTAGANGMAAANNMSGANHTVAFTNTRGGIVPTGVLIGAIGGVIAMALGICGIVFMVIRRRKNK